MLRAVLCSLVLAATPVLAQEAYPTRSITLIIPFAPGGTSDVIGRLAAEEMGNALGQRIVIENLAGAGGSVAMTRAAKANADGYTLIIGNAGTAAAVYTLFPNLSFTPENFSAVGLIAKTMPAIAVKTALPVADLKGFIDLAKASPGKVSLAHAGVGSSNHLICKAFLQAAKIEVNLVSYRGGGPALNDLVGGHVDGVCDTMTSLSGAVEGKQVKALAVASPVRLGKHPEVPTATEAGLPEFQQEGWNAVFAPKGTPQPVIDKLNAALRKAVASPMVQSRLKELSALPASEAELAPAALAALVPKEVEKYRALLKD